MLKNLDLKAQCRIIKLVVLLLTNTIFSSFLGLGFVDIIGNLYSVHGKGNNWPLMFVLQQKILFAYFVILGISALEFWKIMSPNLRKLDPWDKDFLKRFLYPLLNAIVKPKNTKVTDYFFHYSTVFNAMISIMIAVFITLSYHTLSLFLVYLARELSEMPNLHDKIILAVSNVFVPFQNFASLTILIGFYVTEILFILWCMEKAIEGVLSWYLTKQKLSNKKLNEKKLKVHSVGKGIFLELDILAYEIFKLLSKETEYSNKFEIRLFNLINFCYYNLENMSNEEKVFTYLLIETLECGSKVKTKLSDTIFKSLELKKIIGIAKNKLLNSLPSSEFDYLILLSNIDKLQNITRNEVPYFIQSIKGVFEKFYSYELDRYDDKMQYIEFLHATGLLFCVNLYNRFREDEDITFLLCAHIMLAIVSLCYPIYLYQKEEEFEPLFSLVDSIRQVFKDEMRKIAENLSYFSDAYPDLRWLSRFFEFSYVE